MERPDPKRVAAAHLTAQAGMSRTAGEVRFIKDKSNDSNQWAWQDQGEQGRTIYPDYAFDPRKAKALAKVLRSTTASLGHAMAAYEQFSKLKSGDVSPDGKLGGKGYIQKITEMRRAYMNVVEALSALTDTLYDEVRAPHWTAISRQETPQEQAEVKQIVQDALDIKEDPEAWAAQEEAEMDAEHDLPEGQDDEGDEDAAMADDEPVQKQQKMASRAKALAAQYLKDPTTAHRLTRCGEGA